VALSDAYATEPQYRAFSDEIDPATAGVITEWLEAMSRYLEGCLGGRNFNNTGTAVARRINPSVAGNTLTVNPIASLDDLEIVVDQYRTGSFSGLTPLTSLQYQAAYNGNFEPELDGLPYNQLIIPSWSTAYWWSPTAPVQITAIWGWPAVPKLVKLATIELTRIARAKSNWATNRFSDMGEYVGNDARAKSLIYRLAEQYGPGIVVA
jgi:hypothetical protein